MDPATLATFAGIATTFVGGMLTLGKMVANRHLKLLDNIEARAEADRKASEEERKARAAQELEEHKTRVAFQLQIIESQRQQIEAQRQQVAEMQRVAGILEGIQGSLDGLHNRIDGIESQIGVPSTTQASQPKRRTRSTADAETPITQGRAVEARAARLPSRPDFG